MPKLRPVPITIGPALATVWLIGLCLSTLGRGIDYIRDDRTTVALSTVEQLMPLDFWGCVFTAAGILAAIGIATTHLPTIFAGNVLAAGMFAGLGTALLWQSADVQFMGLRTGWGLVVGAALGHIITCVAVGGSMKGRHAD